MDDTTKQKLEDDVKMAEHMTGINSAPDVLDLTNRLIHYQDLIVSAIAEYDYKSSQLKGKLKILQEYMRTSKNHYQNLIELQRKV